MQCPFCKETIIDGAIKCKHCGSILNGSPQPSSSHTDTANKQTNYTPIWKSILIALSLFILAVVVSLGTESNAVVYLMIFISAIWGASDASKIQVQKYKSSFCKSPWQVCAGMLLLWIVIFPWYLTYRSKIKAGIVEFA